MYFDAVYLGKGGEVELAEIPVKYNEQYSK